MSTISPHTTRANGTVLTATIYNADHSNHVANAQALNNDKIEGATPPVVDGSLALFDGTSGTALRDSSYTQSDLDAMGDVFGPAESVDESFARFSGTDGKLIEDSGHAPASAANVRAAVASKLVTSDLIETASAFVTLTEVEGSIAVDWDTFINGEVTIDQNTQIANPTNGQPGTWRTIYVIGNNSTDRTITFGNQFLGEVPVITDCDSGRAYIISILCKTTSHFVAFSKRALG